jgi:hypothetical protein
MLEERKGADCMIEEEEKEQMDLYGITTEQKAVFHYMGYTYDHLADALKFARIDRGRRKAAGEPGA